MNFIFNVKEFHYVFTNPVQVFFCKKRDYLITFLFFSGDLKIGLGRY